MTLTVARMKEAFSLKPISPPVLVVLIGGVSYGDSINF